MLYIRTIYTLLLVLFGSNTVAQNDRLQIGDLRIDTSYLLQEIESASHVKKTNIDSAKRLLNKVYHSSIALKYYRGVVNTLFNLACIDHNQGAYAESNLKIHDMFKNAEHYSSPNLLAHAWCLQGNNFVNLNDYPSAYKAFHSALAICPDTLFALLSDINNGMGVVLLNIGEYQKATTHFKEALITCKKNPRPDRRMQTYYYINLGKSLKEQKRTLETSNVFDSAISHAKQHKLHNDLLLIYLLQAKMFSEQNQYTHTLTTTRKAKSYMLNHYPIFKKVYLIHIFEGEAYAGLNKLLKARESYLTALELVDSINLNDKNFILKRLSDINSKLGFYQEAYKFLAIAYQLQDNINGKEIKLRVKNLEVQYQTAQKDKKIALQSLRLVRQKKALAEKNVLLISIVAGIGLIAVLLLWHNRFLKRKQKHREEISRLKGIIEGEEKERYRLAHELHSGINSQLAAVQAYLVACTTTFPFLDQDKNINSATTLLHSTADNVRAVAHNLASDHLESNGLVPMLQAFCTDLFTDKPVKVDVQAYGDYSQLPADLTLHLFRIAQELATNAKKHAAPQSFTLLLYQNEHSITITAEDNGIGFAEAGRTQKESYQGIGLSGIRKRVRLFNGSFDLESIPGKGTVVHIYIPLKTPSVG